MTAVDLTISLSPYSAWPFHVARGSSAEYGCMTRKPESGSTALLQRHPLHHHGPFQRFRIMRTAHAKRQINTTLIACLGLASSTSHTFARLLVSAEAPAPVTAGKDMVHWAETDSYRGTMSLLPCPSSSQQYDPRQEHGRWEQVSDVILQRQLLRNLKRRRLLSSQAFSALILEERAMALCTVAYLPRRSSCFISWFGSELAKVAELFQFT